MLDMQCNADKMVCMVFPPSSRRYVVTDNFPPLTIADKCIRFVTVFKYLGHVITNDFSDDEDIGRDL